MALLSVSDVYNQIAYGNMEPWQIVVNALVIITLTYPLSTTIFFCIVVRTASNQLSHIRQQLKEVGASGDAVDQIEKLKQYYYSNVEFIRQINRCFGAMLLLEILSGFIGIIVEIIYLVVSGVNSVPWDLFLSSFCFLHLYVINLIGITFATENMRREVEATKILHPCTIMQMQFVSV